MHEARVTNRFKLYGLTLQSDFPFRYHLERSCEEPDVTFFYHGVVPQEDPPGAEVYASPALNRHGESVLRLYAAQDVDTLVFPGVASFACSAGEIHGRAAAPGLEYLVEICLAGNVMAFWLERQGVTAIHASAVVVAGRAACFIAGTSRGKTTTACAFLAAGHALLADDIVALSIASGCALAYPAFPQMKLLPEQLLHLGVRAVGYQKVHPGFEKLMVPIGNGVGRYCDQAVPVGGIYLLDRVSSGTGSPSMRPVAQGEALMELVRHSFAAELVDAVDRSSGRLARLAALARAVPVRRINVPPGYDRLHEVQSLVAAQLAAESEPA